MFDSGVELLDQSFPILEGGSEVDLLACNNLGELILIWTFHSLSADRLVRLLSEYQWVEKNKSLFEHLFPQAKKAEPLGFKVWCFASRLEPEIKSALSYLKGIKIRFFEYAFSERKGDLMLELLSCEVQAAEAPSQPFESLQASTAPLEGPPLPKTSSHGHLQVISNENPPESPPQNLSTTITPEEIQDLMADPPAGDFVIEDEITEPHFLLSDLDPESNSSAG